mmetsp:Transcript_13966/g.34101  ORF Transcript_13966/g.34101 Transcript_13966/m.34101 type:complete len:210 (-) Transcript_13966:797-1426(-)
MHMSNRRNGHLLHRSLLLLRLVSQVGRQHFIKVAIKHSTHVRRLMAAPRVLDNLVGVQDVAADGTAKVSKDLIALDLRDLRCLLLLRNGKQLPLEDLERPLLVHDLGPLLRTSHGHARGYVLDPYSRLDLVHVLPPLAPCAHRCDLEVFIVDLNRSFGRLIEQRHDLDTCKRRLPLPQGVVWADPNQPVRSFLPLEVPTHERALDLQRR